MMNRTAPAPISSASFESAFQQAATTENRTAFQYLMSLYKGNFLNLTISIVFFLVKSLPVYVLPIVTANMINIVAQPDQHSLRELWINFAVLIAVVLQNIPTHAAYVSFLSRAIRSVEAGLRGAMVRKLQQLSINSHRELAAGRLQSKVLRDVEAVEGMSKQLMLAFIPAIFNVVIAFGLTLYSNWLVSLFYVLTVPAAIGVMQMFKRRIRQSNREFRKEIETMSSHVSEMVEMIPVTKAHGLEQVEIDRIDTTLRRLQGKGYRMDLVEAYFGASGWVTFQIVQVVCLLFTAYLAYTGSIPVGNIVMYQGYFGMILGSITALINVYPMIAKGTESISSITEILRSTDIEDNAGKLKLTRLSGEYRFEDVQLKFPDGDQHVLEEVSLDVRAGECIAFVGESGAGKSTILNLVIGFLNPTSGRVLVDGVPLSALDLSEYRRHLAVVPQTNILFSGSIRDNITYGLQGITEEQVMEAVERAHLTEMVSRLPKGIDTMVGEHGGKLSGGQRQRIAIARALVRDPSVILLDEATSALDNASEHHVQQAMQQLIQGRTTFIVAHRLSTIRHADRIVVMKRGRIAEVGTFDELIARKGEFYNLKQLQM
ncbi:ABC transporter ATP-binding protein [Paenibacillus pasadenensis]|uniref:Lipid A export ATP-binding/permease protein MsbA n=1 Tax=Paenibacillus pasadenensis TaxID=217090 RepID=A0A2N5N0W5_9BACL|nr:MULTISPECIES: ABC transporter ATP-binding protein [Paenibacillus]PLT43973.1 Lipid A export ATP-binding/permease protein MsbA [Paenibacillus pasadenensis]